VPTGSPLKSMIYSEKMEKFGIKMNKKERIEYLENKMDQMLWNELKGSSCYKNEQIVINHPQRAIFKCFATSILLRLFDDLRLI
jgi:hypothetical protein